MRVLNINNVDSFVKRVQSKGKDLFWDGWDLVFFRRDPNGFMRTNGLMRNGEWGVSHRVPVNNNGEWNVPKRYAKYS